MYDELMAITKEFIHKIARLDDIMDIDITISCSEDYFQSGQNIHRTDEAFYQQRTTSVPGISNLITIMSIKKGL